MSGESRPDGRVTWRVGVSSLMEAASAVATVGALVVVIEVCRRLLAGPVNGDELTNLTFVAGAVVLGGACVQFAGRVLSRQAGALRREALRGGVFRRLRDGGASTPAAWRAEGARFDSDVVLAGTVAGRSIPEAVSSLLVFLLSAGYLFWVDWRMALVALLPMLLGFLAFGVIATRFNRDMKVDYDAAIAAIDEARPVVDMQSRVHRAGAHAHIATVVRRAARDLSEVVDRFAVYFRARISDLLGGRAMAEIAFSPLTALVIVLIGGGFLVQAGSLAPADLIPFLTVGVGLSAPLLTLTYLAEEIAVGKKAEEGLTSFATGPAPATGQPPLVDLPERGVVTVAGDAGPAIDRIAAGTSAQRLAQVLLDPPLVLGPVGAFIAGDPAAAERAARIAGVHDAVASFPGGYDSEAGADVSLSLSESRRLALAKAVAGDHDIVLLDGRVFADDVAALRAAVDELAPRAVVVCVSPPPTFIDGRVVVLDAEPGVTTVPEEVAR
ncbi:ATP-binding cassette subfamily B protein [Kibdelosporangium banguiense]|uniref:ATP-binding cassette subfamily B protein n=1 Tax=Kibdelosporangium banguiense TaxID=1365924 RepID=A0ABS4TXN7_9PSEU|nr:ABC transporter ATP-binding protein [Kibdelosporangium banguiense]MBP2329144.1 ATP-binding cassette subfamily B protein [Kibdelosporangium banguiense]